MKSQDSSGKHEEKEVCVTLCLSTDTVRWEQREKYPKLSITVAFEAN